MQYKKKSHGKNAISILTFIVLISLMVASVVFILNKHKTTDTISDQVSIGQSDVKSIQATLLTEDIPINQSSNLVDTTIALNSAAVNDSYYQYLKPKDLNAKYVMVYNKTTNQIVYQKDIDALCYPASTTKLLTCAVALEYVSPDTIFTVGDELSLVPADSSLAYLSKGEKISLNDLLYGLMLPSGNDAGYVIAVNVARRVSGNDKLSNKDAVSYFAELMNKTAKNIGMENSNFVVPDGFHDDKHYVTTKDMMKLLLYADSFPLLKKVASTYKYQVKIKSGQDYTWLNSNRLIDKSSEFYYEGVSTGKTGFHDDAGHCMAFVCNKNGMDIYVVIMNSQTAIYRNRDALNLLNMIYNPKEIKIGEQWDLKPDETTSKKGD